jgi:hypothetical protein
VTLMTSTNPTHDRVTTKCHICGGTAIAGPVTPYPFCFKCLFACRDCGVFLPLDQDTRYCDDCDEARHYAAWDKTQP